jgi:hypothetical protein
VMSRNIYKHPPGFIFLSVLVTLTAALRVHSAQRS